MGKSASDIEVAIRSALRVCSLGAKGLWCVMRYVIDESDRPGHLRQNGRPMTELQLAREAGCDSSTVSPLLQELDEAALISKTERTWHSPLLARVAEIRALGAARVRRFRQEAVTSRPRVRRPNFDGAAIKPSALRNAGCNACVTPDVTPLYPSPAPAPSPTPSPLNPTHTPKIPIAAQSASGDAAAGENPEKPRKKGERKLTDDQLETQKSLQEWWIKHAWPASHEGVEYPEFDGSDAAAVLRILKNKEINWDGTRARALLQLYLKQADIYGARGHRLREVGQHLSVYLPMLVRSEKGTVNHNGNGQQHNRASFVGARRSLPTLNGAEPQSVKNEG